MLRLFAYLSQQAGDPVRERGRRRTPGMLSCMAGDLSEWVADGVAAMNIPIWILGGIVVLVALIWKNAGGAEE